MANKLTSAVQRRKEKRDARVCGLFDKTRETYRLATDCYRDIAQKMGIGLNTVILILQKNGRI